MKNKTIFLVLLGALIVLRLLFPGDVPWINDEPKLIYNAFYSNQHHTFPIYGLLGGMGIHYGPLPIWIYKFLLFFSRDLIFIVLLKVSVTIIIVSLSLYAILKILNFPSYLLLIPFVSPYLFFYDRLLWDNSFLIPVSSLFLLGIIKFIDTHRLIWFTLSLYIVIFLIHIHLMSLLIIIPYFIYLFVLEWEWLINNWKCVFLIIFLFLSFLTPYLITIFTLPIAGLKLPIANEPYNWFSPINCFSFWGFDNYFTPEIYTTNLLFPRTVYNLLKLLSGLSFIFFIFGFLSFIVILFKKSIEKQALTIIEKFLSFCTITVICTTLWFTISKIRNDPHYNNAICFVYLFFIFFYLNLNRKNKIFHYSFWVYFFSMLFLLVYFSFYIHISGGNRATHYGPTLKNQIEIARQVNSYDPKSPIYINVDNMRKFPQSLRVLQYIYGSSGKLKSNRPVKRIDINYKYNDQSGWIELKISD